MSDNVEIQKLSEEEAKSTKNDTVFVRFMKENWISILLMIYILSPIDLIPEAILPVIGQTDDFVVGLLEVMRRWYLFKKNKQSE